MKKIAILTGTRAEYGLLKPLIYKLDQDQDLELCLIVTGTHLEESYGETIHEIEKDGLCIKYKVDMDLKSDQPRGILKSMSLELDGLAEVFAEEKIDLLVLLGDRYEILMAAICALINRIPIAHIHGGELTQGLIDEGIRHAVTKMSAIHFTSTEQYRKRVIQMGENPDKVFNVGALGVENIANIRYLSQAELTEKFHIDWNKPVIMVTYHPVTLENNTAQKQFGNLLHILDNHKQYHYIFTYANADTDGQIINRMIEQFVAANENCRAFASMGQEGYLSTLKYAYAVVGNSSSGIIEVPSFQIPTVNIGNRQTGRVKADSIIDCGTSEKEINTAFEYAMSEEFRRICCKTRNPYEGERTSERIVDHIKNYLSSFKNTEKIFYDLEDM